MGYEPSKQDTHLILSLIAIRFGALQVDDADGAVGIRHVMKVELLVGVDCDQIGHHRRVLVRLSRRPLPSLRLAPDHMIFQRAEEGAACTSEKG